MFRGTPSDLSHYAHKKCCGCNVSTSIFKLSPCYSCQVDYCYDCWDGFVRTCKCSSDKAKICNRAHCQQCKNKSYVICCGKNKYCKTRYFGYCNDCFGDRLIYLSKQELLPASYGYLLCIIKQYISDLQKTDLDKYADKIKALEDSTTTIYSSHKLSSEVAELYIFTDAQACGSGVDKTSQYIWSGYVQDNNMTINDLYVKEIVLYKYISLYGLTDLNRGSSIMYNNQLELIRKLNSEAMDIHKTATTL